MQSPFATVFTLFVIPVSFWLLFAHKPVHGLPMSDEPDDQHTALARQERGLAVTSDGEGI